MVATDAISQRESDLLRGVLDLCVLATLDVEPAHAYGVVERLRDSGFHSVGYGTIYPLVTRLRRAGLVEQMVAASPIGPVRKVLGLTPAGRDALDRWRAQWESNTAAATRVMRQLHASRGAVDD